jgi:acyl dehydratase
MIDPKFIGTTYGPIKYEVGVEKIREFAIATGDLNPLYMDEDEAAKGPHGGIVAPPMFAVVFMRECIGKMLFDRQLDINLAMLVHGEQEFLFHSLARPRDVVLTEGKLIGVQQKDGKEIISYKMESKVEGRLIATAIDTFVVRG